MLCCAPMTMHFSAQLRLASASEETGRRKGAEKFLFDVYPIGHEIRQFGLCNCTQKLHTRRSGRRRSNKQNRLSILQGCFRNQESRGRKRLSDTWHSGAHPESSLALAKGGKCRSNQKFRELR